MKILKEYKELEFFLVLKFYKSSRILVFTTSLSKILKFYL